MADGDKDLDQEFIDEVNAGYLLGKYSPEIMDLITQATGKSKYLDALKQGKEIFDKEIRDDYTPDWLKEDRFKENKSDLGKARGKDDRDDLDR